MAYKNRVLSSVGRLSLIKSTRVGGGTKYLIKLTEFLSYRDLEDISMLLDPIGNKKVSGKYFWKFNTHAEATELMAFATLKGLAHGR